jgi:predicted membrane metal-binding protein
VILDHLIRKGFHVGRLSPVFGQLTRLDFERVGARYLLGKALASAGAFCCAKAAVPATAIAATVARSILMGTSSVDLK